MSSTTLTSYAIPPLDSQFRNEPILPSIRQIPNASWPTVAPNVKPTLPLTSDVKPVFLTRPGEPILNKVYFTKKVALQTLKRYDHSRCVDVVEQIWEIPFSVDVNEPVTELVQKIQAVMTAKEIYKHWDINMNLFVIFATQEIRSSAIFEIQR